MEPSGGKIMPLPGMALSTVDTVASGLLAQDLLKTVGRIHWEAAISRKLVRSCHFWILLAESPQFRNYRVYESVVDISSD